MEALCLKYKHAFKPLWNLTTCIKSNLHYLALLYNTVIDLTLSVKLGKKLAFSVSVLRACVVDWLVAANSPTLAYILEHVFHFS